MNRNETTYMSARGALRRAIGMLCALCMAFLALDVMNPAQAQTHVHPSPETMEHLASCVEPEVVDGFLEAGVAEEQGWGWCEKLLRKLGKVIEEHERT